MTDKDDESRDIWLVIVVAVVVVLVCLCCLCLLAPLLLAIVAVLGFIIAAFLEILGDVFNS